jgi:hypothetical protein
MKKMKKISTKWRATEKGKRDPQSGERLRTCVKSDHVSAGFYPALNYRVLVELGGPRIAPIKTKKRLTKWNATEKITTKWRATENEDE